jgi:hypothetical protein
MLSGLEAEIPLRIPAASFPLPALCSPAPCFLRILNPAQLGEIHLRRAENYHDLRIYRYCQKSTGYCILETGHLFTEFPRRNNNGATGDFVDRSNLVRFSLQPCLTNLE